MRPVRTAIYVNGPVRVAAKKQRFRVLWTEEGIQRERSATTLAAARTICDEQAKRLSAGYADHSAAVLNDVAVAFIEAGKAGDFKKPWSHTTESQVRSVLGCHVLSPESAGLGTIRCDNLCRSDIERVAAVMESAGYAVTTINHAVKLGRRLIAFGEDIGVWNAATARKLRLGFRVPDTVAQAAIEDAVTFGAVIDVPTPLEVDRFIAALTKKHPPYGLMARISATTGLRWAEVVVLRTRDIDLKTGVIKIIRALKRANGGAIVGLPKTQKSVRGVKLNMTVLELVRAHVKNSEPDDLLFTTAHGKPRPITSSSSFRTSWWKPAALEAGYTHTWHDLRHYYATRQLAANVGIQLVSQALGHSSPRITWDIYIGNDGSSVDASEAIWGN